MSDLQLLSESLESRDVYLSAKELADLAEPAQERVFQWVDGKRCCPRFLAMYAGPDFDPNDDDLWTPVSLAEEVQAVVEFLRSVDDVFWSSNGVPDAIPASIDDRDQIVSWIEEVIDAFEESNRSGKPFVYPNPPRPLVLCCVDGMQAPIVESEPEPEPEPEPELESESEPESQSGSESEPELSVPGIHVETRDQAAIRLQQQLHADRADLEAAMAEKALRDDEAKQAKRSLDIAQKRFNETVYELDDVLSGNEWSPRLPFDDPAPAGKDPSVAASIECLVDFGLSESIIAKLVEADIETMRELEIRIGSGPALGKIRGIGDSAVTKICDAVINWREHVGYVEK